MGPTVCLAFRDRRVALGHARYDAADAECNSAIPGRWGAHDSPHVPIVFLGQDHHFHQRRPVRTADPTDRGLIVGSAVQTNDLAASTMARAMINPERVI